MKIIGQIYSTRDPFNVEPILLSMLDESVVLDLIEVLSRVIYDSPLLPVSSQISQERSMRSYCSWQPLNQLKRVIGVAVCYGVCCFRFNACRRLNAFMSIEKGLSLLY